MEQRVEFILAWKKGELSMAALCRSFGISRQTGYTRRVDREIEDVVIRARKRHPTWGPRKLRAWLVLARTEGLEPEVLLVA